MKNIKSKNYEIGGFFYFDLDNYMIENTRKHSGKKKYLVSGRQAISFCLEDIEDDKKRALLPIYTCHTVIQPFLDKGYKLFFYSPDINLEYSISQINKKIEEYDISVVLLITYFGKNTISKDEELINVVSIMDITQSYYSKYNYIKTDYTIASLRKWGNSIDGGIAIKNNDEFSIEINHSASKELIEIGIESAQIKYDYIVNDLGSKDKFLNLYSNFSSMIDEEELFSEISPISYDLLMKSNINELKDKRRTNYRYLLKGIQDINFIRPVFTSFDTNMVPLYFPIYIKNREKFQKYMASKNIYLPIIWPKADHLIGKISNDDIEYIYSNIICIPIDQRYNLKDMDYILKYIYDYKTNEGMRNEDIIY